ncbi:MAG TPA: hypothetical protein VII09_06355 [Opitutaceae bacterium]
MALSLGPDGVTPMQAGEWELGVSVRYLYADEGWLGTNRWRPYSTIVGNQITEVSTDFQATYAFNPRFGLTLTVPYEYGQNSDYIEHDGTRHMVSAQGIGDVRLVGSVWLFDPATHESGNISLGIGFKAPTGDDDATGIFYKPTGPEVRPVDIAIQPGDGGWGIQLEAAAYRKFADWLYGYANGYYLLNPREENDAYTTIPVYGQILQNSVPDQYLFRTGLTVTKWPLRHLATSLGLRVNGIPTRDLIGGSAGFRRPGYVTYAEPGLTWTSNKDTLSLYVPIRLDANRTRNIYDEQNNRDGAGAFASYLIVTSYSHRY